jgi:hypothetical protein
VSWNIWEKLNRDTTNNMLMREGKGYILPHIPHGKYTNSKNLETLELKRSCWSQTCNITANRR